MKSIQERIWELEEEIRKTPYHKATEHHIGKLRAKIAKLKEEEREELFKKSGGGGGGYAVKKTGDATVVLVGPPSVGKSTLLNKITEAESKVGEYDFTTVSVIPGMMNYQGAKIQILDVPGIIEGASAGKGKGKQVLSVARSADLILLMVDVEKVDLVDLIKKELYENGIRLGEEKPKVEIRKTPSGGIKIHCVGKVSVGTQTIKELASEFGLTNAEILIKEDVSTDRLIDVFLGNRVYLPFLVVVNKIDLKFLTNAPEDWVLISAEKEHNLELLKEKIWEKLCLMRIYLKKMEFVDFERPLIVRKGTTLRKILEELNFEEKERITKARIFGKGAKFEGQEVSLTFTPIDGTIVSFE